MAYSWWQIRARSILDHTLYAISSFLLLYALVSGLYPRHVNSQALTDIRKYVNMTLEEQVRLLAEDACCLLQRP